MSGILTGSFNNFGWSIVVLFWVIAETLGACMYTTDKI